MVRSQRFYFLALKMERIQASKMILVGKSWTFLERNFFSSKYLRIEDTSGLGVRWPVPLSINNSDKKLRLQRHLQNSERNAYQGPDALAPGSDLQRSRLTLHLWAGCEYITVHQVQHHSPDHCYRFQGNYCKLPKSCNMAFKVENAHISNALDFFRFNYYRL